MKVLMAAVPGKSLRSGAATSHVPAGSVAVQNLDHIETRIRVGRNWSPGVHRALRPGATGARTTSPSPLRSPGNTTGPAAQGADPGGDRSPGPIGRNALRRRHLLSASATEVSSETREINTAQQHYRDLIAAVRLITTIQKEVDREEALAVYRLRLGDCLERHEPPAKASSGGTSWRRGPFAGMELIIV